MNEEHKEKDKDELEIFSDDGKNPKLPSISKEKYNENSSLKSEGTEDAISGKSVKTVIIKEDSDIEYPNYVLDFSNVESINVIQKSALKSLISDRGDTAIYLYKKDAIVKIGSGIGEILSTLINIINQSTMNGEISVYKDVIPGKEIEEIKGKDITKLRMRI